MERPIIFSAESVRTIRAGTKTQTRRVIQPQPDVQFAGVEFRKMMGDYALFSERGPSLENVVMRRCPYGRPGGKLWVREVWRVEARDVRLRRDQQVPTLLLDYAADPGSPALTVVPEAQREAALRCAASDRWKSPMYMPRWASRILLEIAAVRVERLQEISEADAMAEGIDWSPGQRSAPVLDYAALWDSINARRGYPWASNPWVFVVEFRLVSCGGPREERTDVDELERG